MTTRTLTLLTLATALLAVTACREKEASTEIIVQKAAEQPATGPVAMQDNDLTEQTDWAGGLYTIELSRRADSRLPVVTDGQGTEYYDNRFTMSVRRADGTTFFSREFTKNDFASCIDAQYLGRSALLGLVFEQTEGNNLLFAASVGEPDPLSDEYMPLVITLSRTGELTIRRDTRPKQ